MTATDTPTEYRMTIEALRDSLALQLCALCQSLLADIETLHPDSDISLENLALAIHTLARRYKAHTHSGLIHTARQNPVNRDLLRFIRSELNDLTPYDDISSTALDDSAGGAS